MHAVVKTRFVKLVADGRLSVFLIEALKKEFGKSLVLQRARSEKEKKNIDTALAKSVKKIKSPGMRIRFCRESFNMTQVDLAEELNMSFSYVSAWERGARRIRKDNAEVLGDFFQLPAKIFFS